MGDSLLSYGMKQIGNISLRHPAELLLAITNPWVGLGIVLLLAFFASYMTALSWADLTYVLPASSLEEHMSDLPMRAQSCRKRRTQEEVRSPARPRDS